MSGRLLKGERSGIDTQFKKGHVPHNKGKKMPVAVREKVKRTFFKPGNLPHNTQYDGAVSIRTDNRGVQYYWIRLEKGKWLNLQIYNWEKKNGLIPKGYILACKTKDTLNCDPQNWELLTKKENAIRNRLSQWPEDLREVIKLKNKLKKLLK